jgi:hypothetical protein
MGVDAEPDNAGQCRMTQADAMPARWSDLTWQIALLVEHQ